MKGWKEEGRKEGRKVEARSRGVLINRLIAVFHGSRTREKLEPVPAPATFRVAKHSVAFRSRMLDASEKGFEPLFLPFPFRFRHFSRP